MAQKIKRLSKKFIALVCMFTLVFSYSVVDNVNAAGVAGSGISDTLSDSRPGEYPDHTIQFEYNNEGDLGVGDEQWITFTGFTQGSATTALADIAINYGATSAYGSAMATNGDDYTFADVTAAANPNPIYKIVWTAAGATKLNTAPFVQVVFTNATNKLPNPTAAVYTITLSGATNYATGTTQVAIISGVTMSATIDPYMTFVYADDDGNDYTVGFGSWSGTTLMHYAKADNSVATAEPAAANDAFSLTLTSNSTGASVTIRSINAALDSASDTIAAIGANSVANDAEGYAVYGSATGFTMDTDFSTGTSAGVLTTANQNFADTSVVGANVISVDAKASIASTTLAGSYTDTLIFIATPVIN